MKKKPDEYSSGIFDYGVILKIVSLFPVLNSLFAGGILYVVTLKFIHRQEFKAKNARAAHIIDRLAKEEKDEQRAIGYRELSKKLKELEPDDIA